MEQADFEGPLVGWKEKGHTVELVGREAVDGKEAYKLKVTLRSGGVRHDYLDVESLHLIRTETTRQGPRGPVQVEATFGDFKMTDGVLFPRTIEVGAAGRPRKLRIEVDAIEVNPPLSDDRFDMPVVAPS
jgi:hypothetical protein